jgi:hypothetical protein
MAVFAYIFQGWIMWRIDGPKPIKQWLFRLDERLIIGQQPDGEAKDQLPYWSDELVFSLVRTSSIRRDWCHAAYKYLAENRAWHYAEPLHGYLQTSSSFSLRQPDVWHC